MSLDLKPVLEEIESRDPAKLLRAARTVETMILENQKQFAQMQDSFPYNIAGRLVQQLSTALTASEEVAIAYLRLLRGVCLVHRNSRLVFNDDDSLQTLLRLGLKSSNPAVQVASIDTLVSIMVRQVDIIRRFEQLNGLKTVCDVFKQSRTPTAVKLGIIEFLFFYLVPETSSGRPHRKTTQDKQAVLGKYLSNVDGLVRELETNKPFGDTNLEW